MRRFNVTGLCVTSEDYMVDTTEKINQIMEMIENRQYFTINQARQYGKTTTLSLLEKRLQEEYIVASISFEGLGDESFTTQAEFCPTFLRQIKKAVGFINSEDADLWSDERIITFELLSDHITKMCEDRKVVLLIDEVDKASNHRVFLHFLSMLRDKFLARKRGKDFTFHSIVLAGVHDIKNVKLKLINEGVYKKQDIEGSYNSPWNIAADFRVDMSFNSAEIGTMLKEYELDHHTGMDIDKISEEIYTYTSGYPFLVSMICKHIDERLNKDWTVSGIQGAIKIILTEKNTLMDDIFKNLENYPGLYDLIYRILILGESIQFNYGVPALELAHMYGIIKFRNSVCNDIKISNRIFEIAISNYLIMHEILNNKKSGTSDVIVEDIVKNHIFDMELCLRKFAEHYKEISNEMDLEFLERHGRLLFLTYLKPLINGQGFYHIESQFTDLRRMDIIVDFGKDQFIIELKLWKGEAAQKNAYEQLMGYMDSKNAKKGYLLTFDFRKNKETKAEWVNMNGKEIFEVIV